MTHPFHGAYLELSKGAPHYTVAVDLEETRATLDILLYVERLELRCMLYSATPAAPRTAVSIITTKTGPLNRNFAELVWEPSIGKGQSQSEIEGLAAVSRFLKANSVKLDHFVRKGAIELALEAQKDIEKQWTTLSSLMEARDSALRTARGIELVPARLNSSISYELRGFDNQPGSEREPLDEIVSTGVSMVHLETMDQDNTWIGIYLLDGRRLAVNISGKRQQVTAEIDDDPKSVLNGAHSRH